MTRKLKYALLLSTTAILLAGCTKELREDSDTPDIAPAVTVNFNSVTGEIKPLNGINNGPASEADIQTDHIEWGLDATEIYRELEIPYVRTHDTEYPDGSDYFIDIHCIFPDMSRDPADEEAYNFTGTDAYIAKVQAAGAEVFYRLGESIAPSAEEATYQYPPEDYQKWAQICEHIIAHYNYGWKEGFQYGIRYWEIWNEPDMPRQWVGEIEQYYELYKITARYLKSIYPDIKIGGGVLSSAEEEDVEAFLEAINDDGIQTPLDFFSWHLYTGNASDFTYRAGVVRDTLDKYGYQAAETFADEWNYVDNWENLETTWEKIYSPDIAAFYTACFITLQNSKVDGAMYYDGALTGKYAYWCGLYTSAGEKLPGYYSFQAFAKLKQMVNQVEVTSERSTEDHGIYVCAASGSQDVILMANTSDEEVRFRLNSNSSGTNADVFIVNQESPSGANQLDQEITDSMMIDMKPWEMRLITID